MRNIVLFIYLMVTLGVITMIIAVGAKGGSIKFDVNIIIGALLIGLAILATGKKE